MVDAGLNYWDGEVECYVIPTEFILIGFLDDVEG